MAENVSSTLRCHHLAASEGDPLSAIIPLIYEAALAPERWPDVLAVLVGVLGGSAADLRVAPVGATPSITVAHGVEPGAIRSYDSEWSTRDIITAAAGAGTAWAEPTTARQTVGPELERTEFFAGWMHPNGIDDSLCLSLLPPDAPYRAVLSIARPPRRPRFGATEATTLACLAPHLCRAMEVHRRLVGTIATGPLAATLDRLTHGVVLADAGGVIAWANSAATAMLAEADGITLDNLGRLRAATAPAGKALHCALGTALTGESAALPLPRPSGRPSITLLAAPLPMQSAPLSVLPVAPAARLMLLLSDSAQGAQNATLERRLRALWGLTVTEATVAAQTAHGVGLPEVAQVLGLAVTTARTHAQRVFAKAGLRGQAELARQVERLSLLAEDAPGAPAHIPLQGRAIA
jgi:DNA-binding CsgD family transcriptional regulator